MRALLVNILILLPYQTTLGTGNAKIPHVKSMITLVNLLFIFFSNHNTIISNFAGEVKKDSITPSIRYKPYSPHIPHIRKYPMYRNVYMPWFFSKPYNSYPQVMRFGRYIVRFIMSLDVRFYRVIHRFIHRIILLIGLFNILEVE